ncbi:MULTISPECIES: phosphoribosyltransferase [unclassified Archaeoglobus]|jgi:hypothetical protein|uniref:phosphoribosyltransferase n=1 Tax=unclassified Archaeoglobus TaxID=2643606 RepID=UPI0025C0B325|nr:MULTISPECIES: phosphoribosyltransferase [unclassified Archaeoglobus]
MGEYVILSWTYVDSLCRRVAFDILRDNYKPTSVVALAKGGLFVGSILSDYLAVEELYTVDVSKDEKIIEGKRVLLVDDFVNTGATMKKALRVINADEVRTASLLMLEKSEFIPDYLGDYLSDYKWIIFPWNFVEDVSKLLIDILREEREVSQSKLKRQLAEKGLNPLNLEVTFPGRFEEILKVLELKGVVEKTLEGGRTYWRLRE